MQETIPPSPHLRIPKISVMLASLLGIVLLISLALVIRALVLTSSPADSSESANSYEECIALSKSRVEGTDPVVCITESGQRFEEFVPPTIEVTTAGSLTSFETETQTVDNPRLAPVEQATLDMSSCIPGTSITTQAEFGTETLQEEIKIIGQTGDACEIVYIREVSDTTEEMSCFVPQSERILTLTTLPYGGFHIGLISKYCQ